MIKTANEIFGHEEIISNKELRDNTCTCISDGGELLRISKKDFEARIVHPETL